MISIQQTLSVKLHSRSIQILLLPMLFPSKPSSSVNDRLFVANINLPWTSQMALMIKNLPANTGDARDVGLIPEWGKFPEVGNYNPAPVFLPGKFHGQRSLAGYTPWGHKCWTWLNTHMHAAAAKSLQSSLTLCDPRDGSPPGSPVPGILQARTLEWVTHMHTNILTCPAKLEMNTWWNSKHVPFLVENLWFILSFHY